GAATTIVDANQLDRGFYVATAADATLSRLTVRNGKPTMFQFSGGAVFVHASSTLTLDHAILESSVVGSGELGGCVRSDGTLNVLDSTLRLCTAGYGGGIGSVGGSVTVSRSTITTNTASSTNGGGIWSETPTSIDHSAIVYNTAPIGAGGGVEIASASLTAWDTTFGWNSASSLGGGIYVGATTGTNTLKNVTVVLNTVGLGENIGGDAGGIYVTASKSVGLYNSALHGNSNDYSRVTTNCVGSIVSNGFNVISDATGCSVSGAFVPSDPLVGLLKDNGGTTPTFMLSPGSPAVDSGPVTGCTDPLGAALTTDQRGVKRPIGTHCDLGAVEVELVGDVNGDGVRDVQDIFYLINFLFAGGEVPLGRANVNGDSVIGVADVFYLINFLFAGGQPPIP
ncbi:MAG TPA: dockerin type I repeat-containing protein, partial [Thermoanaerobaculia bacterium]|nr:dockerin type I repeat-containing protein [Thermoanaerobaculia bacterium]